MNALNDTMSMPRQKVSKLINAIEQGKLSDEEYATLKRLVEKRDREVARVTAVTRDDTVQHYCSPCSPNLWQFGEQGEGGPGVGGTQIITSWYDSRDPGQQCPPYEGIWEQGRTIANGILTAGVDPSQKEKSPSPTESVDTQINKKRITADTTFLQQGHKPSREQNKQFDPGGREEKAPPWNAAVLYFLFSGESGEAPCLFFVLCTCVPVFPNY